MRPLTGLVVADFSRVVAGPLVGMTLGDLGARVIKVERPGVGDDTRGWGPPWHGPESTYSLSINRNKESIELALDDVEDLDLARRLAGRADVLIENFTPGTMDRFGLGWTACHERNPRLVYCSIEGFGDGPAAAALPGYDLLAQAASGLMSITGEPDGRPLKAGVAIVDVLTALNATIGILAAIEARHHTGMGRRVQVSLMDAAMSSLINQASAFLVAGVTPTRVGNAHPSIAPYSTYRASDREFVLACGTDAQFGKVCAVIGRSELATDARFATNTARVDNRAPLDDVLCTAFAGRPADAWVEDFTAAGVPSGNVNTIAEAVAFATELGLDPVTVTGRSDGTEIPTVRSPIRFTTPPPAERDRSVDTAPPLLGEHNDTVRQWLKGSTP